jgi:hypothetical protein
MKFHLNETANRRITNVEPQNFEGWFRSAQPFINDKIPSFDIRYSLFDIRLFRVSFFDQTGCFSSRRPGCLPGVAWKAKRGHLTPETFQSLKPS